MDDVSFFCIFGRDGVTKNKTEGDWCTPIGIFPVRKIYYRNDKIKKLDTQVETIPISKDDAWCDDKERNEYNTFIKLPFNGSYENLWRDDDLYNIIVVIGYNDEPIVKERGSAIFIHIANNEMQYTKGCLAIKKEDMISLLKNITLDTKIEISL